MDFTKCSCTEPGFCPIFSRTMGVNPPNWSWCQKADSKDRQSFYNLLRKAPPPEKKKFIDLLIKHRDDHKRFFFYYLSSQNRNDPCEDVLKQNCITDKIWQYISQQEKTSVSFEDIEILSLGHKQEQFDCMQDRSYLTKINLNDIDAEKYSGNEWAESRAFYSYKKLFKKNTPFIGFTSASWNSKYDSFSRIDNFHNWEHAKVLLRSKPEDSIILCADILCVCRWIKPKHNILYAFFNCHPIEIGTNFLGLMGLKFDMHIKVPFSNQIITHRQTFEKYKKYLDDTDAFSKIDWFVKNIADRYIRQENHIITNNYYLNRLQAYFSEMLTCFWIANQEEILCIPNAERKLEWYNVEEIKKRIKDISNRK